MGVVVGSGEGRVSGRRPGIRALVIVGVLLGSTALLPDFARATSDWYIRDNATGGDCTQFGTWNGATKTCTLTMDVTGTIALDAPGLTLDGAGHEIKRSSTWCEVGPFSWCPVIADGYSGLTVIDVIVRAFSDGIRLENAPNSRILNNTLALSGVVVFLYRSPGSIVAGNVNVNPSSGCGCIYVQESDNVRVTDNDLRGRSPETSIDVWWSSAPVVSRNGVSNAIRLTNAPGAEVLENTAVGSSPIQVRNSNGVRIVGNVATSNAQQGSCGAGQCYGLYVTESSDATITGNVAEGYNVPPGGSGGAYGYGLWLQDSPRTTITANALRGFGEWGGNGLTLVRSGSSSVNGNSVSASHVAIQFENSGTSTVSSNTITSSGSGVGVVSSAGVTVRGNTITGGSRAVNLESSGGGQLVAENSFQVWGIAVDVRDFGGLGGNVVENNVITGGSVGIKVDNSRSNTVSGNRITGAGTGILLVWAGSTGNGVQDNIVESGGVGIELSDHIRSNAIHGNRFQQNGVGARLLGTAESNALFYNCFDRNGQQISPHGAPYNVWDDGTGRGNWWSDWVPGMHLPHWGVDWYPLPQRMCAGNTPPGILSFSATTVEENTATGFTVVATDSEEDPVTYSWDLDGDGTYESSGTLNTASRTWGDDHSGQARVRVSDGEFSDEATTAVTVSNARPSAMSLTVGEAIEGSPLDVSVRIADPGSDDVTASMEWGGEGTDERVHFVDPDLTPDPLESTDVNPRDIPEAFSHIYGDDTHRAGTLTLTDDDGGAMVYEVEVVVVNGEPQVTFAEVSSGEEAVAVDFSGTARDPGADDLEFCWAWDDGSGECRTYYNDGTFPFWATDSGTHTWGDNADFAVALTVTDDDGGRVTVTRSALIGNRPPVASLTLSASEVWEGTPVQASAEFEDPGTDDVTLTLSWIGGPTRSTTYQNDGMGPDPPKSPSGVRPFSGEDSMIHTYADDGAFSVTAEACDDDGGCGTASAPLTVGNVAPAVSITGPASGSVYAVGEPVTITAVFTDPGTQDVHTAQWLFDTAALGGTVTEVGGSGSVTDTYAFTAAGVYLITLVVRDDDGGAGTADTVGDLTAFVVIYDPRDGFVTGGGWFLSPPGAFVPSPTLTGKMTFGFVSKYQKGKSIPTGETEFQFKVADFNFHSTSYDWLVCGGPKCQFKGQGTVNGIAGYSFMLTAIDGEMPGGGGEDKIRMKIWDTLTGQIVYDNQLGEDDFEDPTTVIGGGSIVIHKG